MEIKSFAPFSVFKLVCYVMLIPVALFILIGLLCILIGVLMENPQIILIGLALIILYPMILLGLCGGLGSLTATIYNLMAKKFGGLEITLGEGEFTNLPSKKEHKLSIPPQNALNPMSSNPYQSNPNI